MGHDKGLISYHGIPQREYMYKVLEGVCDRTFLSVRDDQTDTVASGYQVIADNNKYRGPFNGILSAHEKHEDAAWLVVACDMPLLNEEALKQLIAMRDPEKYATAYALQGSELPEPLCAIWEPRALKQAMAYLDAGNGTCPRKYLINSDIKLVHPQDDRVLFNANSEEEYREVLTSYLK